MHINSWDQVAYPKFTAYLRDSFPMLLKVPNIVSAMGVWGHMTMDEIRRALEWQDGKSFTTLTVDIRLIEPGERWAKTGANEILRPTMVVSDVLVSPKAVQSFEDGRGVSITGYGRKVFSIGAQILGQIVYNFALEHFPARATNTSPDVRQAYAEARRRGFFGQVYGGAPR